MELVKMIRGSMAVIAGPRQTGKTTKLVALVLADPDARLFVREGYIMRDYLKKWPGLKDKIFSIGAETRGMFNKNFHRLYFDDIEHMPDEKIRKFVNDGFEIGGVSFVAPGCPDSKM